SHFLYPVKAAILHEQPLVIIRVDIDYNRDPGCLQADQDQAGFVGADSGPALTFEPGIDDRAGPAQTGLRGQDAIVAAVASDVFHFIADVEEACAALARVDIDVRDVAMLGEMRPEGDGGGVAVPDAEIDI